MLNTTVRSARPELIPEFINEKQVLFPAGTVLFREGDRAAGAYFILSGEVTSSMDSAERGSLPLVRVQAPAYLALVDSITGEQYSCTTRALRDTKGIFIPCSALLRAMSSPGVNLALLKALAEEVSGSYEELRTVRDKFCGRSGSRRRAN
jgi:CRP-like cAMP-binding protein